MFRATPRCGLYLFVRTLIVEVYEPTNHVARFRSIILALALFIVTQDGQNITLAGACCALQVGFQN